MIRLPKHLYGEMLEAAKVGNPEEICGLIGGIKEGDIREVKEIYLLENIDHSKEHFSMSPKDQLEAVKDMRRKGLVPLGNFHSHPESPSRPSEEDKRLAYDKEASYLILSIMNIEEPVLKAFRISEQVSREEKIEYI
ncbi:M67 family metallopeptidase [Aminipila butyrica]|uniref:M67 family metallopeptidase n=1 Tax=Aminipila butyrica TaxID=433296 RepID=A0A858BSC7_9FIRM|nr:M67 family metallopeptidase [Aminipila butyrica]QIB68015.1 M67 family metallopeptidase [Aminipila butyrica]